MTPPQRHGRVAALASCLVGATNPGLGLALAPPNRALVSRPSHLSLISTERRALLQFRPRSRTSLSARPSSPNWEDDTKSSRSKRAEGRFTSTDDFKRPHGMPTGNEQRGAPPPRDNTARQPFQMSSTDDFKRPHGMPAEVEGEAQQQQQQPPPRGNVSKAPFQTSSTDDFKRSSGTPQPNDRAPRSASNNNQWKNTVGQDAYESTQLPPPPRQTQDVSPQPPTPQSSAPQNALAVQTPKDFFDAQIIIDDQSVANEKQPPKPATPVSQPPGATPSMGQQITAEHTMEQWDKKLLTAQAKSKNTLLRAIDWPLTSDPLGESSEYPILVTRSAIVVLSTLATWYLHLFNNCSPVLASSAVTLLVSTFVDRRLGQAALCGSFAGMSGGHLAPNLSMTVGLGGLASVSYEVLVNMNNFCSGIGGRLGATAFLATSIVAKYSGVKMLGRKLRRGLWKSGAGPSSILVTMVLFHILGSIATIFLRESSDDAAAADPVRASSIVGLLGSLFLKDPMAVLALYGGSFVGTSLPSRLIHGNTSAEAKVRQSQTAASLFASFAGAGAIAGLLHAVTIHYGYWNGGWGGKAALCAFAGCWVYRGFGNTLQLLTQKS
ncbi:hypothetical protein ACHAXT_007374 [Thalassiosira profunda]